MSTNRKDTHTHAYAHTKHTIHTRRLFPRSLDWFEDCEVVVPSVTNFYFGDADGDGYGNPGEKASNCHTADGAAPPQYVSNADDCAPGDANLPVVFYLDSDGDDLGDQRFVE